MSAGFFAMLVSGALMSGCVTAAAGEHADGLFDHYRIVTGATRSQTVIPGFFLGGDTAEVAVVHVDTKGHRRLALYGFDGSSWEPMVETTLRAEVVFVDVANIRGRDRLVTYGAGRIDWFDPATGTERPLLNVRPPYRVRDELDLPRLRIARDLTGDGLDDMVLPDVDGFWIATQRADGSFAEAAKLGPPEPFRNAKAFGDELTYGEAGLTSQTNPWYQARVHAMDFDGDGRRDLVFWHEDHFEVHRQSDRGGFDPAPRRFTTEAPFDTDGLYSIVFGFSGESAVALLAGFRKRSSTTVLHSIRDVNGDGVADLVTVTLEGRSVLRQRGTCQVHFGRSTSDGTVFDPVAGTSIRPHGRSTAVGYSSLTLREAADSEGAEAMFLHVNTGLGQLSRVLFANSLTANLAFYRAHEGRFPAEPNFARKIKPAYHTFGRRGPYFPVVLVGDVTGDGHDDLLVGHSRNELRVYPGVRDPAMFSSEAVSVSVGMTDNEADTRLVELTRDGRRSVLVHRRSVTNPHVVEILMPRS